MARKTKGEESEARFRKDLGKRIGEARILSGLDSAMQLSKLADVEYQALTKYIRGVMEPGRDAILRIASTCNVTLDWLMLGADHFPASLYEWLRKAERSAEVERFALNVPLLGYRAPLEFWDLVLEAKRGGASPAEASSQARRSVEGKRPRERAA